MIYDKFDPPGFLDDFNEQQKKAWNKYISDNVDDSAKGSPDRYDFDAPRAQFFNPTKKEIGNDAKEVDIEWTAFPRQVTISSISDKQRWQRSDSSRDVQDEYCEWSIERHPDTDKIIRVTFTSEGPEYWSYLARVNPYLAVKLYQEFVSPDVKEEDLYFANGQYNPRNKWNNSTTNGVMHLIQINNTLGAEIELAAGSSIVRVIDGNELVGEQELIRCGRYGARERHSDPHIGAVVNSIARQKADVTLANPVGLYFADLNTAGWETPDGTNPKEFWKYVRGTDEKPVRAVYEVPEDWGYVVGDIKIGGKPINFGGQIADFINIKLTGLGTRFGQSTVSPMTGCLRKKVFPQADVLEDHIEELSVSDSISKDLNIMKRRD